MCGCEEEQTIDRFNNYHVAPLLSNLIKRDYFRFYKVNIFKRCKFDQKSNGKCSSKSCAVNECSEDQLPAGFKNNNSHEKKKYSKEMNEASSADTSEGCKQKKKKSDALGKLDVTISSEDQKAFNKWTTHDQKQDNFCELEDTESPDSVYYDLVLNPERFTGYSGASAVNVWKLIYDQNCFKIEKVGYGEFATNEGMCLEKKTFYKLISGFHTSINVDVTANWLIPPRTAFDQPAWGPKLDEFMKRFDPKMTWGEGPSRLANMYFAFLVEMRALVKVSPYLKSMNFYTGDAEKDEQVKDLVHKLLDNLKDYPDHFDENDLFKGDFKKHMGDFKTHFRNISGIMDCVGCDKCRLWGKVQFTGMGTALKILFSGKDQAPGSTISNHNHSSGLPFQLTRGEIVALFNAFGRLSQSILEVDHFRKMMQ